MGEPNETPSTANERVSAGTSKPIIGDAGMRRGSTGPVDASCEGDIVTAGSGVRYGGGADIAGTAPCSALTGVG